MFHCFSLRWPLPKNYQLPYLESIFISVFKPCNCSQLYFICNFGVASDFSSRTIFHGRHFSQLVEGWTFGGAVSLSTLYMYTLIHFYRFLSRDMSIIFPCTRLGMSKHIYKSCRAVARSENPGGLVVLGGDNVSPLVEIGLTDLPKTGGAIAPPSPPTGDGPVLHHCILGW